MESRYLIGERGTSFDWIINKLFVKESVIRKI